MTNRFTLALSAALVAAATATMSAAISDPVQTDAGQLSGVTLPSGVRVFKGIPFGAPPVGDLRWRAPQPVARWDGVRKADNWGNVCVQNPAPTRANVNVATDLPGSPKTSEDCLYLNVWTQAERANARLPVMVWIYGGANTEGGGNSPHNDGENLARKGVVLVTFNYRLGPFGFFSHPELTRESGRNASGNQALSDAIATLQWVKANIASFGGDPNNVTIFGESAGAVFVGGLVGSPVAKSLFHRAIAESGQWMGLGMGTMATRESAELAGRGRAGGRGGGRGGAPGAGRGGAGGPPAPGAAPGGAQAGATPAGNPQTGVPPAAPPAPPAAPPAPPPLPALAELRARSTEEIQRSLGGSGMIIDGYIVPEDVSITFANGRQNPVDVLVGSNRDEHTTMGGNVAMRDTMAWAARLFAERQTAIGKKAFWYYFTHVPPVETGRNNPGATHATEMVYVFNNLHAPRMIPDASSPKLAMESEKDRAVADMMSSYWVNFARTGDPNGKGLPAWAAFKDRNAPPHVLGEDKATIPVGTLNAYDEQYAKQVATLMGQK